MISRAIQKAVHFIFSFRYDFTLINVSLPEVYNITTQEETILGTKTEIARNIVNGVTNAAYGNRFAIIPFKDFVAILMGKEPDKVVYEDMENISEQNKLIQLNRNAKKFVPEFEQWRNRFLNAFETQKNKKNEALSILREEVFHHNHLLNTTTWTVSQALTVFYRLSTAYLTYYRYKLTSSISSENKHLSITISLLNTYFIRQLIARFSSPIVEAYFHYKDSNLDTIARTYGKPTYKFCKNYLLIDEYLEANFPTEKIKILDFISKVVMDYPFAYQITFYTGLDFLDFKAYFNMIPAKRFGVLKEFILNNKFKTSDELISKASLIINSPSQLEKKFASSILYYATKGIIPQQLIFFILRQIFVTNYRKVIFHYIRDLFLGGNKLNNLYSNMPAIKSFGLNDQIFNIDVAMKLFVGEAFVIAQNSLEPTLAGDDGYKDILHSEKCVSLLVQTIFIKALYVICESNWSLEKYIEDYALTYRARPFISSHKELIETEILPIFYEKAGDFKLIFEKCISDKVNPFDLQFARKFENAINDLVLFVNSQEELTRLKFLTFCDLNYLHGF